MKYFISGETVLYLTNFIIIITDGNKQEKECISGTKPLWFRCLTKRAYKCIFHIFSQFQAEHFCSNYFSFFFQLLYKYGKSGLQLVSKSNGCI